MGREQHQNVNTIITIDKIKEILINYKIGKKPLARLLGWGETTVIRYLDGDLPTVEYSDKLKAIYANPASFYSILLKNRENITDVAFRKSKKAVLDQLMQSKISVVAQYIINLRNSDISAGYVQVLLFYVQAFSLALDGREMFQEDCVHSKTDIPYPQIYNNMKTYGMFHLDIEDTKLSEREKKLIDCVIEGFTWYGPKALYSLISRELTALDEIDTVDNSSIIHKDVIRDYYKSAAEKYHIHNPEDIVNYPDSVLLELRKEILDVV